MSKRDDSIAPRDGTFRDAVAKATCAYARLVRVAGTAGIRPVDEQMIVAQLRARLAEAEYDNPTPTEGYA